MLLLRNLPHYMRVLKRLAKKANGSPNLRTAGLVYDAMAETSRQCKTDTISLANSCIYVWGDVGGIIIGRRVCVVVLYKTSHASALRSLQPTLKSFSHAQLSSTPKTVTVSPCLPKFTSGKIALPNWWLGCHLTCRQLAIWDGTQRTSHSEARSVTMAMS
jgi:hypothetical protein